MTFVLTCPAFTDGERIPGRFTCEGDDVSPPLEWDDPPAEALSFSLVCSDPDAPGKVWYHWAIFDIPVSASGLPEAVPRHPRVGGARQAVSDFRRFGYGGPCPPRGHGDHRYRFELTALTVAALALGERCDCRAVEAATLQYRLGTAILSGTYSRT